jgi:hypothetical protein
MLIVGEDDESLPVGSLLPHPAQKLDESRLSKWHLGHIMAKPPSSLCPSFINNNKESQ